MTAAIQQLTVKKDAEAASLVSAVRADMQLLVNAAIAEKDEIQGNYLKVCELCSWWIFERSIGPQRIAGTHRFNLCPMR